MTEKEKAKDTRLRREYNITLSEYNAIATYQKLACAACRRTHNKNNKKLILCVDHCHITGKVRGLLCWQCNKGIAIFQDTAAWLLNGGEYLINCPATVVLGKERFCVPGKVGTKIRKKRIKKLQETNGINKTRKMGKKQKKL